MITLILLYVLHYSLTEGSALTEYINLFHLNFLSRICAASGFKGLTYCGGPEVICKTYNKPTILPCVKYNKDNLSSEADTQPSCQLCGCIEYENINELAEVNINELAEVSVVHGHQCALQRLLFSCRRHLLHQLQHCVHQKV